MFTAANFFSKAILAESIQPVSELDGTLLSFAELDIVKRNN